jgi:arylsulfatase
MAGALGLALLALVGILAPGRDVALTQPLRDLAAMATGGAAAGALLGWLAALRPLGFLAPGAIVLGAALGLDLWLGGTTGTASGEVQAALLRGAAMILAGALLGQLIGLLLRRLVPPLRVPAALSLLVVALLTAPLLWPSGRGAPPGSRPNVLLLTIDTLRADRLGLAGHPRPVSPNLDRLARRGRTSTQAVTPLPRTLPAFVSLFTGRVPHGHGVRDNFHYALGDGIPTLAGVLREAGWATAAVNSNPVLSHDSGVYRGFESASDRGDDASRLGLVRGVRRLASLAAMHRGDRASVITELALRWLDRRPRDRPYFLWVHWLSPHMPYEPSPPFDVRFDPGYRGRFERRIDYSTIEKGEMTYRNPLTPAEMEHVKALYDGEVATADRALGRLLRAMELSGDLDNTIVLFTADHGESLDEHGYFLNHGDFVYGPATNIPMVLVDGADPAASISALPTSIVDVMPILLAAVGEDVDAPLDGRVPDAPERPLFGESGFCRFPHLNDRLGWVLPRDIAQSPDRIPDWKERWEESANRAKQRFLQVDGERLVLSPHPDGDRLELFDETADPAERIDLSVLRPERAAELAAGLLEWIEAGNASKGAAEDRVISDEQRERLEGLGYVGN